MARTGLATTSARQTALLSNTLTVEGPQLFIAGLKVA